MPTTTSAIGTTGGCRHEWRDRRTEHVLARTRRADRRHLDDRRGRRPHTSARVGVEAGRGEQDGLPHSGGAGTHRRPRPLRLQGTTEGVTHRCRRPGRQSALRAIRRGEPPNNERTACPSVMSAAPVGLGSFGEIRGTAASPWEEPIVEATILRGVGDLLQQWWGRDGHPHRPPSDRPGPRLPPPATDQPERERGLPRPPSPPDGRPTPPAVTSSATGTGSTGPRTSPTPAASRGTRSPLEHRRAVAPSTRTAATARRSQSAEPGHQHLQHGLGRQRRRLPGRRGRPGPPAGRPGRCARSPTGATRPAPSWPGTRS